MIQVKKTCDAKEKFDCQFCVKTLDSDHFLRNYLLTNLLRLEFLFRIKGDANLHKRSIESQTKDGGISITKTNI